MNLHPIITSPEMKEYREFFPRLLNEALLKFVSGTLTRIGRVVGYPIGVVLPPDVLEYKGDQESLRALRILGKLRENGIIRSFHTSAHDYADEPFAHITIVRPDVEERVGMSGKSVHFFDKTATLWPALGEAVERYCMEYPYVREADCRDASWDELPGPKVDLFNIAGLDNKLRNMAHPQYNLKFTKESVFRWVRVHELTKDIETWAPLQWFSFAHAKQNVSLQGKGDMPEKEPLLSPTITTGAATAHDKDTAIFRGLLEVIERDAFMIYWLNQIPAVRIDLKSFNESRFDRLLEIAADYRFELHLLHLKTDVPVHTVCAVVIDQSGIGPALMIDAKTGMDLADTAYAALHNILAQRGNYRQMMERRKEEEVKPSLNTIGHAGRMHLWFERSQLHELKTFISGDLRSADSLSVYEHTGIVSEDLKTLLQWFKEKEYEVLCRDLISPELQHLTEGLSVVMVRVPQMQPLYLEESLRTISGARLREVPKLLGHRIDDTKADPFCTVPHPFP